MEEELIKKLLDAINNHSKNGMLKIENIKKEIQDIKEYYMFKDDIINDKIKHDIREINKLWSK